MKSLLLIIQIIISLFLVIIILLQSSKGGLGSAFGGGEFRSRRGAEKMIFRFTILLTVLFLIISIANLMVR